MAACSSPLWAQSNDSRNVLIQTKKFVSIPAVSEILSVTPEKIEIADSAFKLYLIKNKDSATAVALLNRAANSGFCMHWQVLNRVTSRTVTPNDQYYSAQYYLPRIQAPSVWQYQNNGLNRRGDTLVVAIIDSGHDTLHPDLIKCRWRNYGEIPGNSIDDDGNGYVDDIYGWNGAENNSRVFTKVSFDAHGTAIAGIIGADTDNDTGISGINHHIKIMPLICYPEQGGGDDLGVIRSMLYAYRMKKLYIQSAGQKGACIVSVNTSIGIDLAFPADAPIWCAMYDSLGSLGILSAAATTNSETDVGQNGDVPSTCESVFTIVTSGTDSQDKRISSGFSTQYVDLAAPGKGIWTSTLRSNASQFGPFASFTGTSFAAPQVAGLIALMHQHACDTFLAYYKAHPDSASLLMSSWILGGVQKMAVLSGKCVTGGLLNFAGAFTEMDKWCKSQYPQDSVKLFDETTVFPNPVRSGSKFSIGFADTTGPIEIQCYDSEGRKVTDNIKSTGGLITVSARNLRPGMYWLRIKAGETQLVRKLLVY